MLIASLSIGDALVTLVRVIPLTADAEATYNLSFTDIPTDNTYTKSIIGEAAAMNALAAWIVADDPTAVNDGLEMLRSDPAMKPHLP